MLDETRLAGCFLVIRDHKAMDFKRSLWISSNEYVINLLSMVVNHYKYHL